jgi:hypothetical protein
MSLLGDRLHERSGFSSFLEPFFFSFHKEKKKVTKSFEIKNVLRYIELPVKPITIVYTFPLGNFRYVIDYYVNINKKVRWANISFIFE